MLQIDLERTSFEILTFILRMDRLLRFFGSDYFLSFRVFAFNDFTIGLHIFCLVNFRHEGSRSYAFTHAFRKEDTKCSSNNSEKNGQPQKILIIQVAIHTNRVQ